MNAAVDGFSCAVLKVEREWEDTPAAQANRSSAQRDSLAMPLSELLHSADKELYCAKVASGDGSRSGKIMNSTVVDSNTEVLLNQKVMLAMLEEQSENQIKILNQLSRHEVYYKELRSKLNSCQTETNHIELEPKYPCVHSVENLEILEDNLKDREYRRNYIRAKSRMFPAGCGLAGVALCHRLLDSVLAREVLTQCSWLGNSWDKTQDNIPFKKFQWVRATFLRIVNKTDPDFSQLECDQFFKTVIRSSKALKKRRKEQSSRIEEFPMSPTNGCEDDGTADISDQLGGAGADASPAPEPQVFIHSAPSSPISIDNGPDIEFLALNSNHTSDVLTNQKIMLTLLEKQAASQTKIMNQLTRHEAYLQELRCNFSFQPVEQDWTDDLEHPPIRNKEELEALEENLKNQEFRKKYIEAKSRMFPADCELGGLAACYKLIDEVVTREFLTECSWTGGSRDETVGKTPFKYFDKVRSAFQTIVNRADPSFSQMDCEKFFKLVIKNAKTRSCSRMLRTSAPKRRQKRPRTG